MSAVQKTKTSDVFALGMELARPVLKGWMSPDVAEAIIMMHAIRTTPPEYKFEDWAKGARWLMSERHERLRVDKDMTASRIEQRVRSLVRRRERGNIVLRDACDINAARDWPFDEKQVRAMVASIVRDLIQKERRFGR